MAIDAKNSMLRQLEVKLSTEITAADLVKVMASLADVMEGFDIRENAAAGELQDDLLDSFLATMKVQGRSQKTIDRYAYIIGRMMEFTKVSTRKISVYHLRAYLAAEKERGISEQTLEGYREIFSSYFNWLQRESLIEKNPTANLGAIKVPKKQRKAYSEIELEKLTRQCDSIRDRAIVAFFASTGCRVSEVSELNRDQVNLDRLECVVHGKGDKERLVYLDEVTGMLVREYLDGRRDSDPALFLGKSGRLLPGGIRAMMNRTADRAGVDRVHPHKFRRTLATNLTRRGMPIQEVARILGHEKLDTTMKYVALNNDDVKAAYRRYT